MHAGHPPPRSANGIFRICSSEVLTPRRQIRRVPSLNQADLVGKPHNAGLRRSSRQSEQRPGAPQKGGCCAAGPFPDSPPEENTNSTTQKRRLGSRQSRIETPRASTTTPAMKTIPAAAMKARNTPR